VEKMSLLPYHKFGEPKYEATGKAYPWKGIPTVSDERIGSLKRLVEPHGIRVDVGR
jgi:pyruvate formate lyase activating enzyme